MMKNILFGLVLLCALSCDKKNDDNDIKHDVRNTHAWFAEGAINTFKDEFYKRIDNITKGKIMLNGLILYLKC